MHANRTINAHFWNALAALLRHSLSKVIKRMFCNMLYDDVIQTLQIGKQNETVSPSLRMTIRHHLPGFIFQYS